MRRTAVKGEPARSSASGGGPQLQNCGHPKQSDEAPGGEVHRHLVDVQVGDGRSVSRVGNDGSRKGYSADKQNNKRTTHLTTSLSPLLLLSTTCEGIELNLCSAQMNR